MAEGELNRAEFRRHVILAFALGVTVLTLWMIRGFLEPLFLAAIFSGILYPAYRWLLARFRRPWLASVTVVTLFTVVFLGLGGLLLTMVVKQALELSERVLPAVAKEFNQHDIDWLTAWAKSRMPALEDAIPSREEIMERIGRAATTAANFLVGSLSTITAGAAAFVLKTFVMLYAMFFFLRDGPAILEKGKGMVPLSEKDKEMVLQRFIEVTRATLKGTILIGFIQGGLCGLGFWATGIGSPLFLGMVTVAVSVIPGLGTALVWVPAALLLFSQGDTGAGILLVAWCGGIASNIDNVLRPRLVGRDARMPDLLVLVGTLGGIGLFGVVGFIVGPIICAVFLTAWDIYAVAFRRALRTTPGPIVLRGMPEDDF